MAVSLYLGVEKATSFKWLQNGDLFRSPAKSHVALGSRNPNLPSSFRIGAGGSSSWKLSPRLQPAGVTMGRRALGGGVGRRQIFSPPQVEGASTSHFQGVSSRRKRNIWWLDNLNFDHPQHLHSANACRMYFSSKENTNTHFFQGNSSHYGRPK